MDSVEKIAEEITKRAKLKCECGYTNIDGDCAECDFYSFVSEALHKERERAEKAETALKFANGIRGETTKKAIADNKVLKARLKEADKLVDELEERNLEDNTDKADAFEQVLDLEARLKEAEKLLEEQECVHNTLQMQRLRGRTRDYFSKWGNKQ